MGQGRTNQGAQGFQIAQKPGGDTTFWAQIQLCTDPRITYKTPPGSHRQGEVSWVSAAVRYVLHAGFRERGWVPLAQGSPTPGPPSSTLRAHPAPRWSRSGDKGSSPTAARWLAPSSERWLVRGCSSRGRALINCLPGPDGQSAGWTAALHPLSAGCEVALGGAVVVAAASRSNELHQVGSVQLYAGKPAAAGTLGVSVFCFFFSWWLNWNALEARRGGIELYFFMLVLEVSIPKQKLPKCESAIAGIPLLRWLCCLWAQRPKHLGGSFVCTLALLGR